MEERDNCYPSREPLEFAKRNKGKHKKVVDSIMKPLILIMALVMMSCSTLETRKDTWDYKNTGAEVVWHVLHAVDRHQTMNIVKHPDRYYELNPILPEHPSEKDVNEFFVWTGLAHLGISFLLPEDYRPYWQYFTIGAKGATVYWNYQVMGW